VPFARLDGAGTGAPRAYVLLLPECIAEAVRQLRGTASNHVTGARNALVTTGVGVPISGAVLGVD
jgi:hypothetical protein